jgi:hypothetical protein
LRRRASGFHEAARQYYKKALQVIASILMDENQPASLRLAAANDLLDRADATTQDLSLNKIIHEVRWLPPDSNDTSKKSSTKTTSS